MKTLTVELGERSYPIHIGPDLLSRPELLTPYIPGQQVLIVSNETVAPLYMQRVETALSAFQVSKLILPDGERYKTLDSALQIYDALLAQRMDRQTTLIALGGGVIGDLTGFAAATYQRGVHFIQIPTTLLAQVDSSVGGKTGVNHPLGKNMIGAFHQPRCVLADTDTLLSLPERELKAGIAEVIKYGLIRDRAFFQWLQNNIEALLERNPEALAYAIEQSCRNKAEVVAADEREANQRALLNLGHTFGHAIETETGYTSWLHGEAVATGMAMAAHMSHELGWLDEAEQRATEALLAAAELPLTPPPMTPERFLELMAVDKKALGGKLRLVLLKAIGNAVLSADFEPAALNRTLNHYSRTASA
ncbi:3-dehydroquinate synthase [Alkalilimnicola ehrlichii]|uniref:3-dehydroquinate synthase n=1 Tax=Alkalilimnicola ehrlichii TaxID=351052 RepID=A0A3E0X1M6_9GAMM|nr:3-dehydroquinate synthase [Alkalilimnicola ehrlichii]RFA39559.1 3-dehydroquinate synthase [Alkalilimnicola ehrlichii]